MTNEQALEAGYYHLQAQLTTVTAERDLALAEREALMEGLGLDPSDDCRDEYSLAILRAAGYGERMRCENLEHDLDRVTAERDSLHRALDTAMNRNRYLEAENIRLHLAITELVKRYVAPGDVAEEVA